MIRKQSQICSFLRRATPLILLSFYALLPSLLISCASSIQGIHDDPLVGRWDGLGEGSGYRAVFHRDRTFRIDQIDGSDSATGTWTVSGGNYALHMQKAAKKWTRTATIDRDDRLSIISSGGVGVVLARHGVKPKEWSPAASAGSRSAQSHPPLGEWRYAYTCRSNVPANSPFPFDIMTFAAAGKMKLRSSAMAKDFDADCKISKKSISIEGNGSAPSLEFAYRWEDGGKRLVLGLPRSRNNPMQLEWAFQTPDQFLAIDIKGTWGVSNPEEGTTGEMALGSDGLLSMTTFSRNGEVLRRNNSGKKDYYRLWKAPFGNAMTIVLFDPEMASQRTQVFQFERRQNEMEVAPVELTPDGNFRVHLEEKRTWKLKRDH